MDDRAVLGTALVGAAAPLLLHKGADPVRRCRVVGARTVARYRSAAGPPYPQRDHGLRALEKAIDVMMDVQSTITCPQCGHRETETMPTDACQFFYDCKGCGAVLRPDEGDCCVYCSFGSVPCPPIQNSRLTGPASCCAA